MVLADEINRTPPKTQAALLEAMQEHRVTVAGQTYTLGEPFFVLATQNPIEQEGTYPLPEAQLDRFMLNLWLEYPTFAEEIENREIHHQSLYTGTATCYERKGHSRLSGSCPAACRWRILLCILPWSWPRKTRPKNEQAPQFIKDWLTWGAGPRASQYLILGAKTRAILSGRHTPDIDDVRAMAVPVLRHRIIPNFNAEADALHRLRL